MGGEEEGSGDREKRGEEVDAGSLFVLKSKGTWWHCGFHLTTSIVAPPLLSLPYAFKFLGWIAGISCLVGGAAITFYSYTLLSLTLQHHASHGHRYLRFRDMAHHILGPKWGRYYVGPIQMAVCYGVVIANALLGGQCLKAMYLVMQPNGEMKLFEFVIIFGALLLVLAQIPSFHSLRHINFFSLLLCLLYSASASAASIYIGKTSDAQKDYTIVGDQETKVFGIFNAIAIIATTYGNGIIPEIQATIAAPVKEKMLKGLCMCYIIVIMTFFTVAITGYWAFGNKANGLIFTNFLNPGTNHYLVPTWFIFLINLFTVLQLSAVAVVYLQPINDILESVVSDPTKKEFSIRNVIPRLVARSLFVAVATIVAAMLPFFGDVNSLLGAFGFIPLDFVLPVVFFNFTFKPSKKSFIFWINTLIAVVFSILGVIAMVAAVRQIIMDASTYKLFADV
ncbi:PREDICTED: GABA transporter 1 [Camelina sativa]|uniref:GABA transporter 1 n=1 Tax=Camelina sativa TaxID=90675 RepID=A0ABM0XNQ7_CAMSA|nr:PREDICTED: GABA transporter 1 [Camelina sativa]